MVRFKLSKSDILRGKIAVDRLFSNGSSFVIYPYRVVYVYRKAESGQSILSLLFSVSKKRFKRAVKRNLIRRRIKEAYRLNQGNLNRFLQDRQIHLDLALLYLDRTVIEYAFLQKKMQDLLVKLEKQILLEIDRKNDSIDHKTNE